MDSDVYVDVYVTRLLSEAIQLLAMPGLPAADASHRQVNGASACYFLSRSCARCMHACMHELTARRGICSLHPFETTTGCRKWLHSRRPPPTPGPSHRVVIEQHRPIAVRLAATRQ
jgi:hypothetical protein